MQPSNTENLQKTAFELFGDSDKVKKWVGKLAEPEDVLSCEECDAGRVFLALSYEHLIESCGHYLLYGSEYLFSIANAVGMAQKLRDRGTATVIECVVPATWLPQSFYRELAGCMIEEMFARVLEPGLRTLDLHFSFSVQCAIPPANIVRFHYPTMIPNPHNRMIRES